MNKNFMKPKFANILFDLDGTLVDTAPDIINCLRKAYNVLPQYQDLQINPAVIGPPLQEVALAITPQINQDELGKFTAEFRLCYDNNTFSKTKLFPEVGKTLCLLKESNFKLFVVTNKPLLSSTKILQKLEIANFFEGVYTPDLYGQATKTKLVEVVIKEKNLISGKTLMVGDLISDILAGKDNKTKTAAACYGYGETRELKEAKPDYMMGCFKEIRNIVKEEESK
jgi:phosphoglycolate phosphatase